MKPPVFRYHRPGSLPEAVAMLSDLGPDARLLAGGQSLVAMMNLRMARPDHLVDLRDVPGLGDIHDGDDVVRIGALVTHERIATSRMLRRSCPMLPRAAATIAHYAIRTQGTVGGSLAHADPAAQFVTAAVSLQAELRIVGPAGERIHPARGFFKGLMSTALEPDEILVEILVPRAMPGHGQSFHLFNLRHGDFAIATVAVNLVVDRAALARFSLVVGGVAETPVVLDELGRPFIGRGPDTDWVAKIARAARDAVDPFDTPGVPAEYRREIVEVLVAKAIADAWAEGASWTAGSGK